jgi:hypothetical protein
MVRTVVGGVLIAICCRCGVADLSGQSCQEAGQSLGAFVCDLVVISSWRHRARLGINSGIKHQIVRSNIDARGHAETALAVHQVVAF